MSDEKKIYPEGSGEFGAPDSGRPGKVEFDKDDLTSHTKATLKDYLSGLTHGKKNAFPISHVKFTEHHNKISALNISVKKQSNNIQNKMQLILGDGFVIKNRFQQRPFVNKMIKSEKLIVYIIFTFILLVSLLSLVASLIVLLMQKQQDIQILFSLL